MLVNKKIRKAVVQLLEALIATPSFSREEEHTADLIARFFQEWSIPFQRLGNNVWATSPPSEKHLPVLLLNSHHDTVKPGNSWTKDPFSPTWEGDRLYGLGSNDAGGPLVALLAVFVHFYFSKQLPYHLVFAATAEEEISGANGIAALLPHLPQPTFGIIGEPTQMKMAIAEKGLMVIDATALGKSGHAAREEGDNAVYRAIKNIDWIKNYRFPKTSSQLGPVKMSVTQIEAGRQHNVVPDRCRFVIDIRSNGEYSNVEILEYLQAKLDVELKARSTRLNSSKIDLDHPAVLRGLEIGLDYFGSSTLSDQALLPFPTLKIGCGDSARSHTADEFILLSEIEKGIQIYAQLLEGLLLGTAPVLQKNVL